MLQAVTDPVFLPAIWVCSFTHYSFPSRKWTSVARQQQRQTASTGKTPEHFLRKEWQSHRLLLLKFGRKGYNDQYSPPVILSGPVSGDDTASLLCPGWCQKGTESANTTTHKQERLLTVNENSYLQYGIWSQILTNIFTTGSFSWFRMTSQVKGRALNISKVTKPQRLAAMGNSTTFRNTAKHTFFFKILFQFKLWGQPDFFG